MLICLLLKSGEEGIILRVDRDRKIQRERKNRNKKIRYNLKMDILRDLMTC